MGHDVYNNFLERELSEHVNKPTRGDNILDLALTHHGKRYFNERISSFVQFWC